MSSQVIETARLLLRVPVLSDAQTIFELYAQDTLVTRYLAWRTHRSPEETERWIRSRIAEWNHGSRCSWVITRKEDRQVMGMISRRQVTPFRVSIAYVLARRFWGQGYMTEAAQAITDHTLRQPEIFRVEAYCDVENVASARVLEKIGMQREGLLRRTGITPNISPEPRDSFCYARVK